MFELLNTVPNLINKTFPMPTRFRSGLPSQIAGLSRLLTNNRGERSLSYLSRPNYLSAYLHYFLPWNLYRLCILLRTLDITLSPGGIITDMGSGPLTFVSALWISRPELRNIPLTFNCIDRCAPALSAGKKFFDALCSTGVSNTPWKINIIREDINIRQTGKNKKTNNENRSALVCAVNLFNEIYESIPHNNTAGLKQTAENCARFMHNYTSLNGNILTVEPGVPQSGRFISLLRDAFMELNRPPLSPCTHTNTCPMPGISHNSRTSKKWCHFAFETADAPKELHRLSSAAKLPKERLVLSYLLTGNNEAKAHKPHVTTAPHVSTAPHVITAPPTAIRVISDIFPLQNRQHGRYACGPQGLLLLTGEKSRLWKTGSGSLINLQAEPQGSRDEKSGALIVSLSADSLCTKEKK